MIDQLTQAKVRELLSYDPLSGIFRWKFREGGYPQWNARFAGKEAGSTTRLAWTDRRYITIRLLQTAYMAHCLAWLYMAGEWCPQDIDHIDNDGINNRWENLRPASKCQNLQNRGKNKNNTSGYKGVWFHAQSKRWCAEITAFGERRRLGKFQTPELAAQAYAVAAAGLHAEFARVV